MANFFDEGGGGLEARDPLGFFKQSFGRDVGGLLDFFRQRLGGQDPAVGQAFGIQRPQINRAFDAARRSTVGSLASTGQLRSGVGQRRLADVGSQRARALSDAISKISLQRETQLPGQLTSLLGSLARPDVLTRKPTTASGFSKVLDVAKTAATVANVFKDPGVAEPTSTFDKAVSAANAGANIANATTNALNRPVSAQGDFTQSFQGGGRNDFGSNFSQEDLARLLRQLQLQGI